jgi:hypothetical protein
MSVMVQRLAYLAFIREHRGGRGSTPRNGIIFSTEISANFKLTLSDVCRHTVTCMACPYLESANDVLDGVLNAFIVCAWPVVVSSSAPLRVLIFGLSPVEEILAWTPKF